MVLISAVENVLVKIIWDKVHENLCQMVLREKNHWFIKWEIWERLGFSQGWIKVCMWYREESLFIFCNWFFLYQSGTGRLPPSHVPNISWFAFYQFNPHWRREWHLTLVSCLDNPRNGGAWWAAIFGVSQSPTRLKWLSSSSSSSLTPTEENISIFPNISSKCLRICSVGQPLGLCI